MMLLAALIAGTPPVPPPARERATQLPAYSATCRLTGRDARDHRLSVDISGTGENRKAAFSNGSGTMKKLAALDQKTFVVSTGNHIMLWATTDFIDAKLGGQDVTVALEVNPDFGEGAYIRIVVPRRNFNLPLFAGMCRTKPFEGRLSS